jgi:uncharacterized protein YabN with tetrapyrrole methylase and pyrophosphatase domain
MIRRHPHVFGRAHVDNAKDVVNNWARIKKEEKEVSGDKSSPLKGVPINLPALLRAHRLIERAGVACNESADIDDIWDRVVKRFEGLKKSVANKDRESFGRKLGEFLFCLVNLARLWGFNSEHLLRAANKEFEDRFEKTGEYWSK